MRCYRPCWIGRLRESYEEIMSKKEPASVTSAKITMKAARVVAIIGVVGAIIGSIITAFLPALVQFWLGHPTQPSLQIQNCDQYGIKIVSPQNHAEVPIDFELAGTYEKQPPDGYLLAYLTPSDHQTFWPQNVVEFDPLNKTWKAQARLLGDATSQSLEADYMIVLVGKSGRLYWDYFWRVNQESGYWIYFNGLTEDTDLCAQVSLKRTK